jgi:hypothetical protein
MIAEFFVLEDVFALYGAWLLLFYLIPSFLFFQRTVITAALMKLDGLKLRPVYNDNEHNVISVDNNFTDFLNANMTANAGIKKNNLAVNVLAEMCENGKRGEKLNPDYYISRFKSKCNNFLYYIFLSLQIPLVVTLVLNSFYFTSAFFTSVMLIHIIGIVLILVLKKFTDNRVTVFTECLYKHWYDKILNFELIAIMELKSAVMDSSHSESPGQLIDAASAFNVINEQRCNVLLESTQTLKNKLDGLLAMEADKKNITWDNVTSSLTGNLETLGRISLETANITKDAGDTTGELVKAIKSSSIDLDAINKNTSLLMELKEGFAAYQGNTYPKELEHLDEISKALEIIANSTLGQIKNTIESNTQKLVASYEEYFAVCGRFNENLERNYEESTVQALNALGNKYSASLAKIETANTELTETVNETSEAAKELCKAAFDFTQYTLSQDFMNRLKGSAGFKKRLEAATKKIVSYEHLAALYEDNTKTKPAKEKKSDGNDNY